MTTKSWFSPLRFAAWVLALISLLASSPFALAWGNFGHEAIAIVAYSRLDSDARERLDAVFAGAREIYGDKTGLDALMYASIWPDLLREGHQHGGHMNVPLGIFQSIGIRNSNQKLADELHFADFAPDGSLANPRANVAVAIRLSYRALADPVSNPMQRGEALAYLVHCLGDAHQPLHCGWAADLGGNTITILGLGRSHARTELHAVFDSGLIRSTRIRQPADYVRERLEPLIPKFEGRALASLDPTTWIQESHQLALEDAYVDENGTLVQNGAILSLAYERRGLLIVDQRLAEAGIRLAALLKPALGRPIP